MLRAAYESFCERGYAATTMDLIAKRAGVAVQTIYFTFNTKAKIIEETVGAAIMGFDRWDPRLEPAVVADLRQAFMEHHPWFPAFESAKTQVDALAVFIDASLEIFARVAPLIMVLGEAAMADPVLKAAGDLAEHRRAEGYQVVVELLAKRGGLRRGVTVKKGTDVMLTLLSAEVYLHVAVRRGWSMAECRTWYLDVLAQQLLPPA